MRTVLRMFCTCYESQTRLHPPVVVVLVDVQQGGTPLRWWTSFSPHKCTVRAEAQQHHSTAVVGVYFHRLNPMQPARLSSRFLGAQRAQRPWTRPSRDLGCRSFGDKFREFGDKFREFEEKVSQSHESRGVVCRPAQLALLSQGTISSLSLQKFMCPRKCPLLSVTCVDLQFHFT